ncbi:hypothetical protein TRFO_14399 [Tritrichomonas foetus]|uniref:Right handed beta helix domain-containing protein n=1 Tax=Tritrichomonas foetus TaxID=1144522 RepID=A0A1J4KZT5_9EUKA|nr:hypothetical protein TRFO_14399 [Tritrichomonas foetus]|eukprot:OHT15204.1 hypothetical protein TRFO_14399 [Tritrichomonas foetus]
MKNLTLLSLSILSSVSNTPYLLLPSTNHFFTTDFRNIHAQNFLNSFMKTRCLYSATFSKSKFDHFISSYPVLSLEDGVVDGEIHKDNFNEIYDKFHHQSIVTITNCQFLSIRDSSSIVDSFGTCIYIKSLQALVSDCYFFSILSYRPGGAVFIDDAYLSESDGNVTRCIFHSITQYTLNDLHYSFLSGVAVSFGQVVSRPNEAGNMLLEYKLINDANMEYCTVKHCQYSPDGVNHHQNGILTFASNQVRAHALNITQTRILKSEGQIYGSIFTLGFHNRDNHNSKSYTELNFYDNQFSDLGLFTTYTINKVYNLILDTANFFNNTALGSRTQWVNYFAKSSECSIEATIQNVRSNSEIPFFDDIHPQFTAYSLRNCFFAGVIKKDGSAIVFDVIENIKTNFLDVSPIDLPAFVDLPTMELAQTLEFTQSNSFTPPSYKNSATMFDLKGEGPITAGVLATIFGILSFISFVFLLYMRRGSGEKFHVIGKFSRKDEFDEVYKSSDTEEINYETEFSSRRTTTMKYPSGNSGYKSGRESSRNSGIGSSKVSKPTKQRNKRLRGARNLDDIEDEYSYTYSYTYSYSDE